MKSITTLILLHFSTLAFTSNTESTSDIIQSCQVIYPDTVVHIPSCDFLDDVPAPYTDSSCTNEISITSEDLVLAIPDRDCHKVIRIYSIVYWLENRIEKFHQVIITDTSYREFCVNVSMIRPTTSTEISIRSLIADNDKGAAYSFDKTDPSDTIRMIMSSDPETIILPIYRVDTTLYCLSKITLLECDDYNVINIERKRGYLGKKDIAFEVNAMDFDLGNSNYCYGMIDSFRIRPIGSQDYTQTISYDYDLSLATSIAYDLQVRVAGQWTDQGKVTAQLFSDPSDERLILHTVDKKIAPNEINTAYFTANDFKDFTAMLLSMSIEGGKILEVFPNENFFLNFNKRPDDIIFLIENKQNLFSTLAEGDTIFGIIYISDNESQLSNILKISPPGVENEVDFNNDFTNVCSARIEYISSTATNTVTNKVGISIFPNPSNDILYVSGLPLYSKLILYDINGQCRHEVSTSAPSYNLPIHHLPSGPYLLTIEYGGGRQSYSITKI